MKLSILSPSFNQGKYLEKNIKSVLKQDYINVEHIVIDGGSTDETVDILKKYSHLRWVSEKDEGQADALNKGLEMAKGDIIGWLNSDDYYEENIFTEVIEHFKDPSCFWVIGNLSYYFEEGNFIKKGKSPLITYKRLLENVDIVRQQPAFFRRSIIEQVGKWNKEFHMLMDYDLWLRVAKLHDPKMVDSNYAYFTIQPDQKTNTSRNVNIQLHELKQLLTREQGSMTYYYRPLIKKKWYLLKSLVKQLLIRASLAKKTVPFFLKK
ncbi:glycosyltransferase family 2 protein [Pontibacter fetidus]|uniref:Glycosyltransferase n=1 Tax=Pontibacter fetidus TaxID=2700082 RepID=A0A6B2H5T8_9BACT|nr:glycosyltransferase family 2 protein [Pontibacter fetidus]NDK57508.1 glycosyltransferase [Pontibacter fetidus]